MALQLDKRHRDMLAVMGVRVWLPVTRPAVSNSASAVPGVVVGGCVHANARSIKLPHLAHADSVSSSVSTGPIAAPSGGTSTLELGALDAPALVATASVCQACSLCSGRRNSTLFFPEMQEQADWFVVGDPPDEEEDRAGRPFAQEAGILLANMLKAVGVSRAGSGARGAYVSNVVKCRSPHGRIPKPSELERCAAYLHREIALVRPKVIVAMGRFAVQTLLHEHTNLANLPLGKLRGGVYHYQGVRVVVTYHPKALLHNSADKAKAWADLCLAMDVVRSTPVNTL